MKYEFDMALTIDGSVEADSAEEAFDKVCKLFEVAEFHEVSIQDSTFYEPAEEILN